MVMSFDAAPVGYSRPLFTPALSHTSFRMNFFFFQLLAALGGGRNVSRDPSRNGLSGRGR